MQDLFNNAEEKEEDKTLKLFQQEYSIQNFQFPLNIQLHIREFTFHPWNANIVWPGNKIFIHWIIDNLKIFHEKKIVELGSASGILR